MPGSMPSSGPDEGALDAPQADGDIAPLLLDTPIPSAVTGPHALYPRA